MARSATSGLAGYTGRLRQSQDDGAHLCADLGAPRRSHLQIRLCDDDLPHVFRQIGRDENCVLKPVG